MLEIINGIPLVIELAGGLGNQMFQYVFGKLLLHNLRILGAGSYVLCYDTSAVLRDIKRKFLLPKCLNNKDDIFIKSRKDLFEILGERVGTSLSNMEKIIDLVKPYTKGEISDENASYILIHEKKYLTIENDKLARFVAQSLLHNIKPVFIRGYWQRGSAVVQYLEQYPYTFELPNLSTAYKIMHKKISEQKHSVSIHVRRSDYLDEGTSRTYPPCTIEYYIKTITEYLRRYPDAHFFLFSDDVVWLKKNFISQILFLIEKFPSTIVSTNSKKILEFSTKINDYEELFLMNQCIHHILANSSYSWWGSGMLSINRVLRGTVTVPSIWHIDALKSSQILLPNWSVIEQ